MQDKYVGDAGDFGKYGLLRFIFDPKYGCKLKLGINWYHVPNDGNEEDGNKIGYLLDENDNFCMREADSGLYSVLKKIVKPRRNNKVVESHGTRVIDEVQHNSILPANTLYYDSVLHKEGNRGKWHEEAIKKLQDSDIVFLDPDNGLEPNNGSIKHVFDSEVVDYYQGQRKSLIIYQHGNRGKHRDKFKKIKKMLNTPDIFYLHYRRYGVRYYLFILRTEHKNFIERRINELFLSNWCKTMNNRWKPHFEKGRFPI
ncbi:MAG: hypothetical protein ABIH22_03315 [Candidatus Margulisiibacteriota bacterium]